MMNVAVTLLLTNVDTTTCRLMGYTELFGVNASGKQVPLPAQHGDFFADLVPRDLRPGATGQFQLGGTLGCLNVPTTFTGPPPLPCPTMPSWSSCPAMRVRSP